MPLSTELSSPIVERINNSWLDELVAIWVVAQLPLLNVDSSSPAAPILSINNDYTTDEDLPTLPRILASGGFEGTKGHVSAAKYLQFEVNTLFYPNHNVTLLLEPDSYIRRKNRFPLVTQIERAHLWARSSLIDTVIMLPTQPIDVDQDTHYQKINELLPNAKWCISGEHPFTKKVLLRNSSTVLELCKIIPTTVHPHASFLYSTKNMTLNDLQIELLGYVEELVKQKWEIIAEESPALIVEFARIQYEEYYEELQFIIRYSQK